MAVIDDHNLGSTAVRAVKWNYLSFVSGKVLVLVTTAILARLLTPAEFGIVGFAVVGLAYLAVLRDLGLGGALIQRRDDLEEAAQTVFTLNLVFGALLTVAAYLLAPAAAGFFHEPQVTLILRVLSFSFLIEAFGSVHIVLLKRDLDFRRKLVPDLGRSLVKGGVAITAALMGAGVWALVYGQLAGGIAYSILSWIVVSWRPTMRVHRALVSPMLRFGFPLTLTNVQYALWANVDYLVVGRLLGDVALGIYTIAYRLPDLLIQALVRVVADAAFPVFSAIQDDLERIKRAFLMSIRLTQMILVPVSIGLLVTAHPTVHLLFGDQWTAAVPVLQWLAAFSLIGSVGFNAGDVYKAIGRPDILAKLGGLDIIVLIPAVVVGAHVNGIVGVAIAHTGVALLGAVLRLLVARHFINVRIKDVLREVAPAWKAGALLAVTALAAVWIAAPLGPLTQLLVTIPLGAVAYSTAIYRFDAPTVKRMLSWVGLGRRGQ